MKKNPICLIAALAAALSGCPNGNKDSTAPVLSWLESSVEVRSSSSAAVRFTSNEAGTYWVVVCASTLSNPANGAAVKDACRGGVNDTIQAIAQGSAKANTAVNALITGLTWGETYKAHVTVQDAAGNYSAVWSSEEFTPRTITYTITTPTHGAENGVTPSVSFSPSSPAEADTTITATILFSGRAQAAGTFSIGLSSAGDVNATLTRTTGDLTQTVSANAAPAAVTYTFTMPLQDVDDLVLTFVDNVGPTLSLCSVTDYALSPTGTTAAVQFTSNEIGTYYVVVYPSGTAAPANGAALEAVYNGGVTGSTKARAQGSAAASTAAKAGIAALEKDTAYQAHITVKDGGGNYAAVWSSGEFIPTEGVHYTLTYDYEGADGGNSAVSGEVTPGYPYTLTVPTKTGHIFAGWYTGDDGTGTQLTGPNGVSKVNWAGDAGMTVYAKWDFSLGDDGPAGGLIFYVAPYGFWNNGVECHYFEAAPADLEGAPGDLEGAYAWGGSGTTCGVTGTAIGGGGYNTARLTVTGHNHLHPAAQACADYEAGGYDDWFLPSKDELALMYTNLKAQGLGGFSSTYYWSSSEYLSVNAWYQNFANGSQYGSAKFNTHSVRAARAF
ncbi:MAG: DUF1566 domain-containing protein [Treponema sp.]|nr:DUF1566 domain-containing protein [Treponema sp.]